MEGGLEAEALGQTIGALAYAYKEIPSPIYLAKAKLYADWLLQFQDPTVGNAVLYEYNNATQTFDDKTGTTISGWVLWGMSVLYDITNNATYKTFLDKLMDCLVNDNWLWNSTQQTWDDWYDKVTGWTYATSNAWAMKTGAAIAGLSAYYRYVEQNATVKSVIQTFYDNHFPDAYNAYRMGTDTEQTMYNAWGMYEAWQAFNNVTYRDEFIDMVPNFYHAYNQINSNGSINNYPYLCDTSSWDYLDGWGGQVGLPLLMISYETSPTTLKQKAFEKYVFDWINLAKGEWAVEFRVNNPAITDKSWSTGSLFIHLGLLKYFKQFVTDPYVFLTDAEITATSYSADVLTFTVSASSETTSTTQAYVGSKGKPLWVSINGTQQVEGTTWTYNETLNEVTIWLNHTTPTLDVKLSWAAHSLIVDVFQNDIPINANISLFDANMTEIETIPNATSHEWLLPEATYYTQASITYNEHPYSSNLFKVNLNNSTRLAINFQFSNLTIHVTDIHNQPLENALILLKRETEIRGIFSNKSGTVTIEAYYGNWTIRIRWMNVMVGESTIAINDAKTELTIKSNVGNLTINVTDPYGQPIKTNVTLTNTTYRLSISKTLNGTTTTTTFTQIPLINYTLTIENEYGTQTYTIDTTQTKQINIKTTILTTKQEEKTIYILIGTIIGALITATTAYMLNKKRRKTKPLSTTHQAPPP